MAKKPGRLYRVLQPTGSLFEFVYGDKTLTDDEIRSISIHHGGDGLTPSTLEVVTTDFDWVNTGRTCQLSITPHGMDRLTSITGHILGGAAPRFTGRIGKQVVDDQGARDWYTTFFAATLDAQYPRMKQTWNFSAGTYVDTMLRYVMQPRAVVSPPLTTPIANYRYGQLAEDLNNVRFSDVTSKYITDLGFTYRILRNGTPQLLTHDYRHQAALGGLADALPLSRSQALRPAKWEQSNELTPRRVRVRWLDQTGNPQTILLGDNTAAEVLEIDMQHVRFTDDTQPRAEAAAQRARELLTSYELPEVTVDLLHLLSSPHLYHRLQAANLLTLHINDPVYFAGDWFANLRGITYAEEITETITKDEWTLTLKLAPSENVTGFDSPEIIPARTWEQSTLTWGEETRTWYEA